MGRFAVRGPSAERNNCFDSYPALVPQRATRLGTVTGLYQSSREARDWIALLELSIAEASFFASYGRLADDIFEQQSSVNHQTTLSKALEKLFICINPLTL